MGYVSPTALLAPVCDLARRAGAVVMSIYYTDFSVATKSDRTPVTIADQTAEKLIIEGLRQLTPGIPVVAEEAVSAGQYTNAKSQDGLFWLVDPLDGTKEFVQRRTEFTVNIALISDGHPALGVVYAPVSDQLYAATSPNIVLFEKCGSEYPTKADSLQSNGIIVVVSKSYMNGDHTALERFLKNYQVQSVIYISSSLKLCLLATGQADLYPRFNRSMEWDTAAGHAVLNATGGYIRVLGGEELHYGKFGYYNPHFIAYSRRLADRNRYHV